MLTDKEKQYCKEWRIKNSAKLKVYNKNLRLKNRERLMLNHIRYRAKKLGLEFNLDISDIEIPEYCCVLNLKLDKGVGNGQQPNSPSIDRIDCKKGYVKGNIRIISHRANRIKTDASFEEIEKLYQDAKNLRISGLL